MSVTLRTIAAEAHVSAMTVSRVLNGKNTGQVSDATAARIREAASRLGYAGRKTESKLVQLIGEPAHSETSNKVYCLIPYQNLFESEHENLRGAQQMAMLILEAAMQKGISLEFLPATEENDPTRPRWDILHRLPPESRIITCSYWYATLLLELNRRGARIAMLSQQWFWHNIYRESTRSWAHFICRTADGFATAVTELLNAGKKKIALIVYKEYINEPDYARSCGYFKALEQAGNDFRCIIPVGVHEKEVSKRIFENYEKHHFDALIAGSFPKDNDLEMPPDVTMVLPGTIVTAPEPRPGRWRILYPGRKIIEDALNTLTAEHFIPQEKFYDAIIDKSKVR